VGQLGAVTIDSAFAYTTDSGGGVWSVSKDGGMPNNLSNNAASGTGLEVYGGSLCFATNEDVVGPGFAGYAGFANELSGFVIESFAIVDGTMYLVANGSKYGLVPSGPVTHIASTQSSLIGVTASAPYVAWWSDTTLEIDVLP
jgi:hypothetical protein